MIIYILKPACPNLLPYSYKCTLSIRNIYGEYYVKTSFNSMFK